MEPRPNFARHKVEIRIQPVAILMEHGRVNQPTTINKEMPKDDARGTRGVEITERGMCGVLYRIVCLLLRINARAMPSTG